MLDATPLLRLYARWRLRQLTAQDPKATQAAQLLRLVRQARRTRFGRDHDFAAIRSVDDFQRRVPLRKYEDFHEAYWRHEFPVLRNCTWPGTIPYFAVTSGTTADVTKYIPCSHQMNRSNRRGGMDILVHHVANRPHSRILGGRSFMLGGSTDLTQHAPGVLSGDLSGIAVKAMPRWARMRYFPPLDLALIADWEKKVEVLANRSLEEDIRMLSGTPSWMLVLIDRLAELRPEAAHRLAGIYENLELVIHGGVNFAPYRRRFAELMEGSRAETREVYAASEGMIAVADRGDGEGMRLELDTGLFYEFVPLEELDAAAPTRHWVANAELGVNYAVVLSTCAGVWGYVLGDTVKFVSLDPPRILVTGRTSYMLSAFGEHLIGEEIEEAVSHAAEIIGATLTDYSVAPVFPAAKGELGGHLYVVEFAGGVPRGPKISRFASAVDDYLSRTNEDYQAHRAGGFGLRAPEVAAVAPGTFAAWMKHRGKLGGQNKVPRIINDQELFADLQAFRANN
ncbi:MAG: GH3 auxin-responsive promoter family protein [Alphaproteobacteria bacterium]